MARMGMDVDEVEKVAQELKARAGDLGSLIARIDAEVRQLPGVWQGRDAGMFVNSWWPGHKKHLVELQSSIGGLGQSAWNNAQEQRQVSSGSPGGGNASVVTGGGPTAAGGDTPGTTGVSDTGASSGGGTSTGTGVDGQRLTGWISGVIGKGIDYDGAYGNQCVDLVNDYAHSIFPDVPARTALGGGNAMDLWGNSSTDYFDKIPGGGTPQAGDILCIGPNRYSSVGHVAVVESVENGVIKVVQQNGANPGGVTYRGSFSPGGVEYAAIQGFLRPKS